MSTIKLKTSNSKAGFTLLEILLVVGIISILAGIVILAINPTKQLGDARNAQRRSDVLTILNAVYQYSIDNNGNLPASASTTLIASTTCSISGINLGGVGTNEIGNGSSTSMAVATTYVDLYSSLVGTGGAASSTYLVSIPHDPQASSTANNKGSGYAIVKTASNRVTVCAPLAENSVNINVTR